jgi:hypothetical protein
MQRDCARGSTWRVDRAQGGHHRGAMGVIETLMRVVQQGLGGYTILLIPQKNMDGHSFSLFLLLALLIIFHIGNSVVGYLSYLPSLLIACMLPFIFTSMCRHLVH